MAQAEIRAGTFRHSRCTKLAGELNGLCESCQLSVPLKVYGSGELTLLISWGAFGLNAARKSTNEVFIRADTFDVQWTASPEGIAYTGLLRVF